LASVLTTPELLGAAPGLKVASQGLIQPGGVRFPDVHDGIGTVALALADDIHTGLAAQGPNPGGIRLATAAGRAGSQARIAQTSVARVARGRPRDRGATLGGPRPDVHDHRDGAAGEEPGEDVARHGYAASATRGRRARRHSRIPPRTTLPPMRIGLP